MAEFPEEMGATGSDAACSGDCHGVVSRLLAGEDAHGLAEARGMAPWLCYAEYGAIVDEDLHGGALSQCTEGLPKVGVALTMEEM